MLKFQPLHDIHSVASQLEIPTKKLTYILYIHNGGRESQYKNFTIPKKNGSKRQISAPLYPLKNLQQRLQHFLELFYNPTQCTHGFIKNRSILTNAKPHTSKHFIINIDLKDFFPSINFGRVRGLFLNPPFNATPKAATVLAQIACFKNELPQGSPSSPIISNLICRKLDSNLIQLAKRNSCYYTRYADDITFSTNRHNPPVGICTIENGLIRTGELLTHIIESNGFNINIKKTRIQCLSQRQEVTGLVTNQFPNIKRIYIKKTRLLLHNWEKFGLENAANDFCSRFDSLNKSPVRYFKNVLRGRVEFIYNIKSSPEQPASSKKIAHKIIERFLKLDISTSESITILSEGPTDLIHLRAALHHFQSHNKFKDLNIRFYKTKHIQGCPSLDSLCERIKKGQFPAAQNFVFFIFDGDNNKINQKHKNRYRKLDSQYYSYIIPEPKGYEDKPYSIEMLYGDEFIKNAYDEEGRRLYINTEFNPDLMHKKNSNIRYGFNPRTEKYKSGAYTHIAKGCRILDSNVMIKNQDQTYKNIALTKVNFALNIIKKRGLFKQAPFEQFEKIFRDIQDIISS